MLSGLTFTVGIATGIYMGQRYNLPDMGTVAESVVQGLTALELAMRKEANARAQAGSKAAFPMPGAVTDVMAVFK